MHRNHSGNNDTSFPGRSYFKGIEMLSEQIQDFIRMNINRFYLIRLRRVAVILTFMLLYVFPTYGQDTIQVKGVIVNSVNQPVANVSVGVEGSKELPTVTNEAGEFTLKVVTGDCWLNIAPSSKYKKKRVFLNNRTSLKIYVTSNDLESGDDFINILALDILKRDMVSSFSFVNTNNIKETPTLSVDQYFEGKVSGMFVTSRSGDPGAGTVSLVRGLHSIYAPNTPLYIIDGIPMMGKGIFQSGVDGFEYNPFLAINPLDISEAAIIKDPTITAAYGSKASNGIVYIETLDPSATETSIELDLRSGLSLSPSRQIPQLDAGQHKTLISEVLFSSGEPEEQLTLDYPNLFLTPEDDRYIDYQHNTNWQDKIFNNAAFYDINIKVKGGDEIASYGLSFGYMSSDGIIKNTGYDGYNLRFVSLLNIFKWLKMNATVSLAYTTSDLKESGIVAETSPIMTSLFKSPMLNPYRYDNEGRELTALADVDELGVSNPQAVIDNFEATNNNFEFISSLGFRAKISDDISFQTNFGLTYNLLKESVFMPNIGMELYYDDEAYNVSKLSNNSLFGFYNNSYLKFHKLFGANHKLSSVTGMNTLLNDFQYDWGLTKNSHENDQYRNLQDGASNLREIGGINRTWNWMSFYEYLSYSFKDKYMVTGSVSLDGSSRVGDNADNTVKIGNQPFGLFYSAGVAWRLSNEGILKNVSALEDLKLRFTYGVSGNDNIGEASATNYYKAARYRETVGLIPAVIPNDSLTYETVTQLDAGLDIALWGNRVRATFDVYQSTTDNLLINAPVEAYFGFDYRTENGGKMRNKGFDVDLFVRILDKPKFKWDITGTVSKFQNEILEIKGNKLVIPVVGAEVVNMVGEKANSFYGFIYEGVYSTSEEAQIAGLVNEKMIPYQAGDAKFKDISGPDGVPDGIINDFDKTVIGSSMPDLYGGLSNTFTYKRWALNVFLQFVTGNESYNYVRAQDESMKGLENQSRVVLNRWQYEGQVTDIPRAVYGDVPGNSAFSSRWIEDGSYMRLKNVSLSYTIPDNFLVFKNAKFYISANNILTVTKYLGYDPEFAYSYMSMTHGIDYGLTPNNRQFVFGIKLGL